MWDNNKVTVAEVQRYTKPIVSNLLEKYNKVTHPDFDEELRKITGIGWKQIKNYRNHPNPNSEVKSNSKVGKYILLQRRANKFYKLKRGLVNLTIVGLSLAVIFTFYRGLTRPYSQKDDLNLVVKKNLEEFLGNKGLHKCTKLDSQTIDCPDGRYIKKLNE